LKLHSKEHSNNFPAHHPSFINSLQATFENINFTVWDVLAARAEGCNKGKILQFCFKLTYFSGCLNHIKIEEISCENAMA
jgi:hypothetical protein